MSTNQRPTFEAARGDSFPGGNGDVRPSASADPETRRRRADEELAPSDSGEAEEEALLRRSQLDQAQRLEAIGQLAAGLAHEINTPIQYVGDNVRFLRTSIDALLPVLRDARALADHAPEDPVTRARILSLGRALEAADVDYLIDEAPRAAAEALSGLDRVTAIVTAMKEFSNPGNEERSLVDINHAIRSAIAVARPEWRPVADIETDLAPALEPIPCRASEVQLVVLNLLVNAAHAIEDALLRQDGGRGTIRVSTAGHGDSVEIRVSDTGSGIPAHVVPRVFDPFFTTKEVGKGTGQGLAIAHNVIVKKHGGRIDIETGSGRGTTFVIRIPRNPIPESGGPGDSIPTGSSPAVSDPPIEASASPGETS